MHFKLTFMLLALFSFMASVIGLIVEGDSVTFAADQPGYVWQAAGITAAQVPSVVAGVATTNSYSPQYWPFYWNGMTVINRSVGGSRVNTNGVSGTYPGDASIRGATWVDALINNTYPAANVPISTIAETRPTRKYILSVMLGTNPDSGTPATQTNTLKTYIQARLTACPSIKGVVVCTLVSRGDNILTDEATFETYRQGVNTIQRGWTAGTFTGLTAFAVADFGNEATVGAAGACDNLTLYASDKIHPTAAGHAYLVPLWTAAVNTVKAAI